VTDLPRILLAVPCERTVLVEAVNGIVANAISTAAHGWEMMGFGYDRTDVARNRAAHALLASDCDALVMLDSDHVHKPRLVEYLAMAAAAHPEVGVIAGLNFRRMPPHEPMAYKADADGRYGTLCDWPEGLVEVDACSTASMLIRREVFAALEPPWFAYTYETYDNGIATSEDIAFCRRVTRETGYPIYVHTQLTSPHITTRTITAADFARWMEEHPE
jgi:GT2 family glycosyltransferase